MQRCQYLDSTASIMGASATQRRTPTEARAAPPTLRLPGEHAARQQGHVTRQQMRRRVAQQQRRRLERVPRQQGTCVRRRQRSDRSLLHRRSALYVLLERVAHARLLQDDVLVEHLALVVLEADEDALLLQRDEHTVAPQVVRHLL